MSRPPDVESPRQTAYDPEQFADNYPDGIERHYWNVCRNRVTRRLLQSHAAGDVILEIGCGRGVVVDYLRRRGLECWGCDTGLALPIADEVAPYLFLQRDAFGLDEQFREGVRTLLLLDLLEHIEEPAGFLSRCRTEFANARIALITLPARDELWSNYDDRFGHFRRYDPSSLRDLLDRAAVAPVETGYFFHALYAPIRMVSALRLGRRTEVVAPHGRAAVLFHRALGNALAMEARLLPRWLPGSSIYAVIRL